MATITMRRIRDGEVPFDGGTALQEDVDRPVFSGNGPDDYVCVECGNLLATAMHQMQMTKKVRVRCARCATVNVSVTDDQEGPGASTVRRGSARLPSSSSSAARLLP
jgi:phage FluMu protein Com